MSKHPREIVEEFEKIGIYTNEYGYVHPIPKCDELKELLVNSHTETLEQEIEFLESQFEMAKSTKQFMDKCRWNDCLNAQIFHLQQQLSEWRLMK